MFTKRISPSDMHKIVAIYSIYTLRCSRYLHFTVKIDGTDATRQVGKYKPIRIYFFNCCKPCIGDLNSRYLYSTFCSRMNGQEHQSSPEKSNVKSSLREMSCENLPGHLHGVTRWAEKASAWAIAASTGRQNVVGLK